jgi:hypothetical protein
MPAGVVVTFASSQRDLVPQQRELRCVVVRRLELDDGTLGAYRASQQVLGWWQDEVRRRVELELLLPMCSYHSPSIPRPMMFRTEFRGA